MSLDTQQAINAAFTEALTLVKAGDLDAALTLLNQAIKTQGMQPRLVVRACVIEEQLGQSSASVIRLNLLLAQLPEHAALIFRGLARGRNEYGDMAGALDAYRQMMMHAGAPLDGWIEYAEIANRCGLLEVAKQALQNASQSEDQITLTRLANVAFQQNLWLEATEVLQKVVELYPESADAWFNLAKSQVESWRMADAQRSLSHLNTLKPGYPGLVALQASMAGRLGDAHNAFKGYQKAMTQAPDVFELRSSVAFSALYCDHLSLEACSTLHHQLFEAFRASQLPVTGKQSFNALQQHNRLRVGFITADLHRQHPICIFMLPVLQRLDRQRLHISIFNNGQSWDQHTTEAKACADAWHDVFSLSDAQLADLISASAVDVLVDLSGHSAKNRMAMLAQRAAPIQVTFLGYPYTTGLVNMDYLLADRAIVPVDEEKFYSERILFFPHGTFCYVPEETHPIQSVPRDSRFTFGSFNNLTKLSDTCVRVWSSILHENRQACLLLKAPSFADPLAVSHTLSRFAACGITSDRLILKGPVGLFEMMQEYNQVDCALDPIPYNGGTTSVQALWMGVPLVTLNGRGFVQKMGASLLSRLPQAGHICMSESEYITAASTFAKAGPRGIQARLAQRIAFSNSSLADIDAHVASWHALLSSILEKYHE